MRTARLKLPSTESVAVYHCISKIVNAEYLLDDVPKEKLRKMIYRIAEYCGVEILTFVILDNHFHILVRVPLRTPLDDAELLRRYQVLYPDSTPHKPARIEVIRSLLQTGGPEAQAWRDCQLAMMGDVSRYMQLLKQRFSIWYNKTYDRIGTLWCERFKSSLVEPRGQALLAVAAYIDLNPVRAGIVSDPKDYRFCGYAEALGGSARAREGLEAVLGPGWESEYRQILLCRGASSMKPKELEELLKNGGKLPLGTLLRCRVRYLIDGAILGSEAWVRTQLAYFKRDKAPVPLPPVCDWDLAVIRRLRRPALG